MPTASNIFCVECDSILDISRTGSKKQYVFDGSSDEEEGDRIKKIISKMLKQESVKVENINKDQIMKHEDFLKLTNNDKKTVLTTYDKLSNVIDSSSQAYYVCRTCGWSQKMKGETQILSKIGNDTQTTYLNKDRYKNRVYNRVLPITRNYICPNKNCPGNKNSEKHEAVMYRHNDTLRIMYTCIACQEVFFSQ